MRIVPAPPCPLLAGWLVSGLLLATCLPAHAVGPVAPVDVLDIDRYAGHWHEIAHLPVSFQKKCVGDITATYSLHDDGRISVLNRCRTDEGVVQAEGVARPVPGQPGKLQVRFVPDWLSWVPGVWADYWVIALDPGYQWAMVGEPGRRYLWILSRTPGMDHHRLETLKARAQAMGYDLARLKVMAPVE